MSSLSRSKLEAGNPNSNISLEDLASAIRRFVQERGWEKYNRPKNLALAICGEAGELAAEFQWLTDVECDLTLKPGPLRDGVIEEMADVLIYLVRLADVINFDLMTAAFAKMSHNAIRFPPVSE